MSETQALAQNSMKAKKSALWDQYQQVIEKIRACAPEGVSEAWEVTRFDGVADYRLNIARYRVVGVCLLATRVTVFMEWRKLFRNREIYEQDPDFDTFEDAFGYLGVNENWNQPWNVYPETDLDDPYVEAFLTTGMRLLIKELKRIHPELESLLDAT